jgi:hypothetical protein
MDFIHSNKARTARTTLAQPSQFITRTVGNIYQPEPTTHFLFQKFIINHADKINKKIGR